MAWSDTVVRNGTVIQFTPSFSFRHSGIVKILQTDGRIFFVHVQMAKVRAIANSVLGYNSRSVSEIIHTFEEYALNKHFVSYTAYEKTKRLQRDKIKSFGWTIL